LIGEKVIEEITGTARLLLTERLPELQQAYKECEGTFNINISTKAKPCPEGVRLEISIGFVQARVRESAVRIVNDEQMGLGFE